MSNRTNRKWRRFLAFLRKYAVAVRNVAIFIIIIVVICWCRSQIRRDANACAFNAAVAKLTHGPQHYHEVVKDLEKLERELSAQKKSDALLFEVRKQLSQCCAMIAADSELCMPEGSLHWYRRAWESDANNESIPPVMRTHFEKQAVAVDFVEEAEIETKVGELTDEKKNANDAAVVESKPSLDQASQQKPAAVSEEKVQPTVEVEASAPVSAETAEAPAEVATETASEVVAPQ